MSEKPTTIIRAPHGEMPFFQMNRATAQDEKLSFAARGVLTYLLSKPDDWRVDVKDLQQGCGRDKVYSLLDELIENRYIAREQVRNDKQQIEGFAYVVYERPLPEKPDTALPDTVSPDTENTDTYIEESIQKTDSTEDSLPNPASAVSADVEISNPEAVQVEPVASTGITSPSESALENPLQSSAKGSPAVVSIREPGIAESLKQGDPNLVYIGRANKGWNVAESKWGNPYTTKELPRAEAIAAFEKHLLGNVALLKALPELRGKTLVCWCSPAACHGDVLARYAALPDDELQRLIESESHAKGVGKFPTPLAALDGGALDTTPLPAKHRWAYMAQRIGVKHLVKDQNYPKQTLCGEGVGSHMASKGPEFAPMYRTCPHCLQVLEAANKPKPKVERKPSIVQPVEAAIAEHVQGIAPKLGGKLTGVMAQAAAGIWRKQLEHDKLTADEYAAIARSIKPFVEWYRTVGCPGCDLPADPRKFEDKYSRFVSSTLGHRRSDPDPVIVEHEIYVAPTGER